MSPLRSAAAVALIIASLFAAPAAAAWQPSKPIEFIATAGPGGGTDNLDAGRGPVHGVAEHHHEI